MLSYKTIVALQCIPMLRRAGTRGATIFELQRMVGRQHNFGIRRTMSALTQAGWVGYARYNRFMLLADVQTHTLYDLVMAIDGELQLDTHVALASPWGPEAENSIPNAISSNEYLHRAMAAMLKGMNLDYLTNNPDSADCRFGTAAGNLKIKTDENA